MIQKNKPKAIALFYAIRPAQWTKNLGIFASIIINGKLFDNFLFDQSLLAFIAFCLLSSSSYLVNDVVDYQKDKLHPSKRNRPLASGQISKSDAISASFVLFILGLFIAALVNPAFFILSIIFIILQYSYSFILKKKALLDIIGIAVFFIIRTYAGEIASGYHLPIWLMLSVIFLSLFIASGKRRSEIVKTGSSTRPALLGYSRSLLTFYSSIFAVSTLLSYAMFTFFEEPITFDGAIHRILLSKAIWALNRKWYMITLFPVIFGIMRYGQIIFEMQAGERPEKIIATDIPLLFSILFWGLSMIVIVYVI